jgi:hypothetical protein
MNAPLDMVVYASLRIFVRRKRRGREGRRGDERGEKP